MPRPTGTPLEYTSERWIENSLRLARNWAAPLGCRSPQIDPFLVRTMAGGRGRGRGGRSSDDGRGRGSPAGSQTSDAESDGDPELGASMSLTSHPLGVIIASHAPPKGIRFTINKHYFRAATNFDELPDRLLGEIDRWVNKKQAQAVIIWPQDESNTIEFVPNLFDPSLEMKLEPYAVGNKSAPKAKGLTARRLYAKLMRDRTDAEETSEVVQVSYSEGALSLTQIWDVRGPKFIKSDWRPGDRFRMQTRLPVAKTSSVEKSDSLM